MQLCYKYFDEAKLKQPNSKSLGNLMYIFAACMLVVAIVGWLYIPEVQNVDTRERANTIWPSWWVENKTLEELAEGRQHVVPEDRVGLKERFARLRKRFRKRFTSQQD
jgi:hypothetical protein